MFWLDARVILLVCNAIINTNALIYTVPIYGKKRLNQLCSVLIIYQYMYLFFFIKRFFQAVTYILYRSVIQANICLLALCLLSYNSSMGGKVGERHVAFM